jgi:hypothetical protein
MEQSVSNELAAKFAHSQLKLCPYNEKEPAIWFRLIEAQFAAEASKVKIIQYANALANALKQVLRDIYTVDSCNGAERPLMILTLIQKVGSIY